MAQDIVADALNQIMNAKQAGRKELVIARHSKLLRNILDMVKQAGYLDYEVEGNKIIIKLNSINEIRSIKPRYPVSIKKLESYVRRYLPARNFGFVLVSTNKGLMKHSEAQEKNIGGCLIAYVF